jgi:hypothetical protein
MGGEGRGWEEGVESIIYATVYSRVIPYAPVRHAIFLVNGAILRAI